MKSNKIEVQVGLEFGRFVVVEKGTKDYFIVNYEGKNLHTEALHKEIIQYLAERFTESKLQKRQLTIQLNEEKSKVKSLSEELEKLKEQQYGLKKENNLLNQELDGLNRVCSKYKKETKYFENRIEEEVAKGIEDMKKKYSGMREKCVDLILLVDELKDENSRLMVEKSNAFYQLSRLLEIK